MRSGRLLPPPGVFVAVGRVLLQDMRLPADDDAHRHMQE